MTKHQNAPASPKDSRVEPDRLERNIERFQKQEQARQEKRRRAFLAADEDGDLATQVQIAREPARDLILIEGIKHPLDQVQALAGDFKPAGGDENEWGAYCTHVNAAFALGIAVGQLTRSDVFAKGGDR